MLRFEVTTTNKYFLRREHAHNFSRACKQANIVNQRTLKEKKAEVEIPQVFYSTGSVNKVSQQSSTNLVYWKGKVCIWQLKNPISIHSHKVFWSPLTAGTLENSCQLSKSIR